MASERNEPDALGTRTRSLPVEPQRIQRKTWRSTVQPSVVRRVERRLLRQRPVSRTDEPQPQQLRAGIARLLLAEEHPA